MKKRRFDQYILIESSKCYYGGDGVDDMRYDNLSSAWDASIGDVKYRKLNIYVHTKRDTSESPLPKIPILRY